MVNMVNLKKWIALPLLSAGFVLVLLVHTSNAALLKDIRVGEYEGYTRIVFELDAPAEPEKIEHRSPGHLAVVFGDTSADLIRKIPVGRSAHVDKIQIWEQGNRLTAVLAMDFKNFGQESFSLTNPPRLVVDIRPTENAPHTGAEPSPGIPQAGDSTPQQAVSTGASAPSSNPDGEAAEKSASETAEPSPSDTHKASVSANEDLSPAKPPTSATRPSGKRPGRLQFYLVIILVAITIVILALLLLMLLARHRWIGDKSLSAAGKKPESPEDMTSTRRENESL
jgi:hypothetical protein